MLFCGIMLHVLIKMLSITKKYNATSISFCDDTQAQNTYVQETSRIRRSPSSATTVLSFVTLHTYCKQFDWQNIVFMNIYEAGETNLLPMKPHVTITYFSISVTSYLDFFT